MGSCPGGGLPWGDNNGSAFIGAPLSNDLKTDLAESRAHYQLTSAVEACVWGWVRENSQTSRAALRPRGPRPTVG